MFTFVRYAGLICAATAAAVSIGGPAEAANPAPGHRLAYVRAGSIYLLAGATEARLTYDSDDARPRWSPDGLQIAYLHGRRLWVVNADGTGKRALTAGPASGAAWSPDGHWLAYAATSCTGIDGVFRIASTGGAAQPLFPAECRTSTSNPPSSPAPAGGTLAEKLRNDSAVAWSPDGTRLAFRGGQCQGIFDDCLSVGDIASGGEQVVAGYGGGGVPYSGFAVIPAWRPDGQRLAWTAEQESGPIHVVEADPGGQQSRTVGVALDRELVYDGTGRGVLTGQYRGASWVIAVDLATGVRTPLRVGSQPAVDPAH